MTLIFAYGCGIPLAALFCFYFSMDLAGMWFGISVANGLLVIAIDRLTSSASWESIAQASERRNIV